MTKEELTEFVSNGVSYKKIAKTKGLSVSQIEYLIRKYKIKTKELKQQYRENKIRNAVANNLSYSAALRELGLKYTGGNYQTLHRYIKYLNLDTSHMTGQGHLKGKTHNWSPKIPAEELFVEASKHNRNVIRRRLLSDKLIPYECFICGISEWRNNKLSLELHHINGNGTDNRIENLIFLCPNCHSQTNSHSGKNKKK